ncbi:MAG: enoyl-CoA hydratase-related protein, partial [Mycobacterium sp.]
MTILIDDHGAVRTIKLNRPEVRNAIDIPMRIALADALEAADADNGVRVIVLT